MLCCGAGRRQIILKTPQFSVAVLGRYRIQNDPSAYAEEPIYVYEFEFYTEDYPGGTLTDGVFRPARKGSFCLFKPGQHQRLIPPYQCYVMNIQTQDPELRELLDRTPTFCMMWNIDEVIKLLNRMLAEDQSTLEGRLRIQSDAGQILSLLSRYSRPPENLDTGILRHQALLQEIDRYIRRHLDGDLSLAVLAKQSNLDATYFHKLFTAAFGKTPAKLVLDYRIAAVKTGLLDGKESLDDLATRCGFSSASYMGYKFRQITGQTPSQYRKAMLRPK